MREYICIVCPNGCHLRYDEETDTCTGNKCPRGAKYAHNEYVCPKRTVCTSVKTDVEGYPVVSVKTDGEIEKSRVGELMKEINKVVVHDYLDIHSVVIENVLNTGVNIITTTPMKPKED